MLWHISKVRDLKCVLKIRKNTFNFTILNLYLGKQQSWLHLSSKIEFYLLFWSVMSCESCNPIFNIEYTIIKLCGLIIKQLIQGFKHSVQNEEM